MLIDVGRLYLQQSSSNRVAVIPIDPSSHISGGSILGKIVMNTSYRLMDGWMDERMDRWMDGWMD